MNRDEFHIGYRPTMPPGLARFVAIVAAVLLLVAVGMAVTLSASQDEPSEGTFAFGEVTGFAGFVRIDPYPRLELVDGSTVLLVAPFKHGADSLVAPFVDSYVSLAGSVIERGGLRMVEVLPDSIRPTDRAAESTVEPPAPEDDTPAPVTVRGEIVDGKCWLGVMKPGSGTVHRACARLCIRGGVPALLDFVDAGGTRRTALIVTSGGERLSEDLLKFVARPVEITGAWHPDAAGGIGIFFADRAAMRVL